MRRRGGEGEVRIKSFLAEFLILVAGICEKESKKESYTMIMKGFPKMTVPYRLHQHKALI